MTSKNTRKKTKDARLKPTDNPAHNFSEFRFGSDVDPARFPDDEWDKQVRLAASIHDQLARHNAFDIEDLEVAVNNEEIILKGMVRDETSKRTANDIAVRVAGANHIVNQLQIKPQSSRS